MTKDDAEKYRCTAVAYLLINKFNNKAKINELMDVIKIANRLYITKNHYMTITYDTYVTESKKIKDIPFRFFDLLFTLKNSNILTLEDSSLKYLEENQ